MTTGLCCLFQIGANLTDYGFLWIDLVLLTSLSITCEYLHAASSYLLQFYLLQLLSGFGWVPRCQ